MDLFAEKKVSPMLIAEMKDAFDDPDWIFELKLDGCRCVAYLEDGKVTLRNKRNMELLPRFPELVQIYKQTMKRCVLDGELVVLMNGKPDFYELQKRTLISDRFKIELGATKLPASFIAYDCLQAGDKVLLDIPLMERKGILTDLIVEDDRFAVSRFIPEKGIDLFQMTVQQELEGVVAKRKNSLYHMEKRTKDWIKFKRMADEDFLICGYVPGKVPSLVLGEAINGEMKYAGTVTMGVRREDLKYLKKGVCPFKDRPKGKEEIVWCMPEMMCTVEYMPNTKEALRQPVYKGIRTEISPTLYDMLQGAYLPEP